MKTKSFLFSLILAVGLIGFYSCEDDDPSPLNKEKAEVAIDESEGEFVAVSNEIATDEGYKVQAQLDDMYLPFEYSKSASLLKSSKYDIAKLKAKIAETLKCKETGDINFNFDFIYALMDLDDYTYYTGTWDLTNGEFVKTSASPSDEIVLNFPYPSGNTTNNATLRYYDIKFGLSSIGFKGTIKVNSNTVLSFGLSASVSDTKMSASMNVEFGKFEMSFTESASESSSSYVFASTSTLKKDGDVVYKVNAKITMTQEDVVIEANMTVASLEFRLKIDLNSDELQNIGTLDRNDYVKMSLYTTGGAKIGDFVQVYNSTDQRWNLYFVYTDGTQVAIETALPQLGGIFDDFYRELYDEI
ncbi:hypothetical protein CYCD_27280 [Tenuifilaceae bacterium CYCD]|nr:hypothetical protein CYCD_27280 [Tenuifilaceae bacterium CYCD]